jgi:hypothetical protein
MMSTRIGPTLCIVAAFAIAAIAPPIHAAYVLENGLGTDLCEIYRDNLNAAKPKAPYAAAANRPLPVAFPDFQAITWSYPPEGAPFPSDAITQFFWKRDANPAWYLTYPDEWLRWKGTPTEIQKARRSYVRRIGDEANGYAQSVSFRLARVDIDNDGALDNVAQFSPNPQTALVVLLNEQLAEVDAARTELVLRHSAWGNKGSNVFRRQVRGQQFNAAFAKVGLEPVEHALHGASYSVFSFRRKTYYDLWWLNDPQQARSTPPSIKDWRLRIFSAEGKHAREVCKIRFDFE